MQPVGPVLLEQWVMLYWWADCPWRLWIKGVSATKTDLCDGVANVTIFHFLPRQKSPNWHSNNQRYWYFVQGETVSYFEGKGLAALYTDQLINLLFYFLFIRYVFFLDPCNLDLINRKIKSIALCVSKCPSTELKTHSDLKQFALSNGEKSAQVF